MNSKDSIELAEASASDQHRADSGKDSSAPAHNAKHGLWWSRVAEDDCQYGQTDSEGRSFNARWQSFTSYGAPFTTWRRHSDSTTEPLLFGISWSSWLPRPEPKVPCARRKLADMAGSKRIDRAQAAASEGFIYEDETEEDKWTTACGCLPVKMHTVETFRFEGDVRFLKGCYVVVGLMNKRTGVPREVVSFISLANHEGHWSVFPEIKAAIQQLLPWWKRVLSLKSIVAFSIYRCHPDEGYHEACEMVDESGRPSQGGVLASFFTDYTHWAASPDESDGRTEEVSCRWGRWVRLNFNGADFEEPPPGQRPSPYLSLELVLRWSPLKIAVYGLTPILLSLVVGFWYQFTRQGDPIAVAQAAWGISSFILAASGLALAVLAAITQLGGI